MVLGKSPLSEIKSTALQRSGDAVQPSEALAWLKVAREATEMEELEERVKVLKRGDSAPTPVSASEPSGV